MPFQSEKQRRFLHANHPEIAKRWEKEYATGGISNHFRKKFFTGALADTQGPAGGQAMSPGTSTTGGSRHVGGGGGGGNGGTGGNGPKPHSGPTAAELAAAKAAAAAAAQKKAMEEAQLQAKEMALQRQHKKKKVDYSKKLQAFGVNEYENLIKPGVVDYQKKHLPDYDVEGFDLQMKNLTDHARFLKFKKKSGVGVPKDYVVDPYSQTLGEMLLGEAHTIPIGLNIEQTDYLDKVAKKGVVKESGQFFTYDSPDDVKKQLKKLDEKSEEWIGTDVDPKKIVSGDKTTYATDKDVKAYLQKKGIELKDDMGRKLEIGLAHGGILDINASEEIISDDGNDIELTAYNAAFDDPKDLSTGVKTLFQAKDGGRIGYAQGWSPGVAAEERAAEKSSGGGQYHGGGADVMAVQSVGHPTGDAEVASQIAADDRQRKAEADLAFSRSPGSDEEKYDTEEQMLQDKFTADQPGNIRRGDYEIGRDNKALEEALAAQKSKFKKMGWTRLLKAAALLVIGVPPKDILRSVMITKDDMEKILKESIPIMQAKHKLQSTLEKYQGIYEKYGMPTHSPHTDTKLQDVNQQILDLTQRPDEDDTKGDGPELPQVVPIGEEIDAYAQDDYSISPWERIKANQAKRALLVKKGIIQDSPIVDESVTDITMEANSGGLANLFRVKNQ